MEVLSLYDAVVVRLTKPVPPTEETRNIETWGHRLRRWPNVKPTMFYYGVFAGYTDNLYSLLQYMNVDAARIGTASIS